MAPTGRHTTRRKPKVARPTAGRATAETCRGRRARWVRGRGEILATIDARARLLEGEPRRKPLGIFVSSLDPASTDIMALAGLDFVVLDGEHGRFSRADIENHVRAARLGDIVPLVRVLENAPTLIQSMLDLG